MTSVNDFFSAENVGDGAVPQSVNLGNSPWAQDYSGVLKDVIRRHERSRPRNQQTRPGPSSLGSPCDRMIVAGYAGVPRASSVADVWPAIVGTATHAWLADAFDADNTAASPRWKTEQRISVIPGISGSGDLYDTETYTVGDHKVLGESTYRSLVNQGPPLTYIRQLLLYALGFKLAGHRVDRIAIIAHRRAGRLSDLYVWETSITDELKADLRVTVQMARDRMAMAERVVAGELSLDDVSASPSRKCVFCSYYRPQQDTATGWSCSGKSSGATPPR